MARLALFIVTAAVLGWLGYRAMTGGSLTNPMAEPPKERLDNVQKAADRIEQQQQEAADRALEKADERN